MLQEAAHERVAIASCTICSKRDGDIISDIVRSFDLFYSE